MLTNTYYIDTLYPLQDQALQVIRRADTEFYLTGGTAACWKALTPDAACAYPTP